MLVVVGMNPEDSTHFSVAPSHDAVVLPIRRDVRTEATMGMKPDWPMQLAVFNRNLALDRVGGDEELLREVAQLFLQEYPSLMGQLEEAVARDDAGRVMETAHTMKGSLATLGAEAGTHIALQLETMGRHRSLTGSRETCRALVAQLNELESELQKVATGV